MPTQPPYFWKRMPFVRLIIPLISGILIQHVFHLPLSALAGLSAFVVLLLLLFTRLSISAKYTSRWLPGFSLNLFVAVAGGFFFVNNDISHKSNWTGNYATDSIAVVATLQEPLVEKAKSYKAEVRLEAFNINGEWKRVTGKALLYFSKDSSKPALNYGSQVVFYKPLQPIKNAGNPGGFDYKQYCAFQDIYHQLFLKTYEYKILPTIKQNVFRNWLFNVRTAVINILQRYIKGDREAGVAEALLIGYRNDLDKDLVQAYSNTGVVHIIAISGLHLGMIYMALVWLLKPFKKTRWIRWVKPVIILLVLWVFTALAGGVPSILRSAVMFTFIVLGESINKKSSIYNTLAASAFVMLCYNPYFLWDIGFLLSYAAVISIVAFSKPIHNWFYIKNKLLDFFWQLTSVTLAAQILTVPIIFYAFHQFPNLFLVTNCLIVPLSSVILFAELLLVVVSLFIPVLANFIGFITSGLLAFMNNFIENVSSVPYAVYDGIQNNLAQTVLLYVVIIAFCLWLLNKSKHSLFTGLATMFAFVTIDAYEQYYVRQQKKLVVYNIPQHNAIDFIAAKNFAFTGDTVVLNDRYLTNFHLKPSRTLHRVQPAQNLKELYISRPFASFYGKRVLVVNKPYKFYSDSKIQMDLIVICHNPRIDIADLANSFDCKQYAFDASNSPWRINQWKKDCDSLGLSYYSTADDGAFEMKL